MSVILFLVGTHGFIHSFLLWNFQLLITNIYIEDNNTNDNESAMMAKNIEEVKENKKW